MDKFKGALMVGALRLFAKLPWGAVQRVGAAIGWIMWKVPNSSRNVVRINLAKCFRKWTRLPVSNWWAGP